MKKNILFIDTGYEYGGGTKSLIYLLEGLSKDKYNIFVFFENDYKINSEQTIYDYLKTLNIKTIKNTFNSKKVSKLNRELYRLVSKDYLYKKELKSKSDFVMQVLESNKFDLIHLNNHFGTNLEYIIGANELSIPVIQHLRKNSLLSKYQINLLKDLIFHTVSVSQSTYKFYSNQVNIDSLVIYNPFPIEYTTNKTIDSAFDKLKINILMPANYLENKGHKLVFKALEELLRDDIVVYLAGNGVFDKETEYLKNKLMNENKIVELGFISNIEKLYIESDYILSFSQNEGLPRVVIEGLMYGCNIITSDYSVSYEIQELLNESKTYSILNRDSQSLLNKLMNLKKVDTKIVDPHICSIFSLEEYINSIDILYVKML